MCVKKLKSGRLLAVWNPIPVYNGKVTTSNGIWIGSRTPLVCSVLDENGNYNSEYHIIESDEDHGYCYCAIHETENGDILLGYCSGGKEDGGILSKLRIKKIQKEALI